MTVDIFILPMQSLIWFLGFLFFIIGFLLALILSNADKRIYASLRGIPRFMYMQVLSLMKMKSANEISVATRHFHDKKIEELK
jgi:preprotein translocase subunit SecG